MTEEKLMDRVRAILRKAEESRNSSEAERETAMRMAQRLLLKHGLTMADVGNLEEDAGSQFMQDSALETEAEPDYWRGSLLHVIGDIYFCQVYYQPMEGTKRRWIIVGRSDHVQATQAMYEFVAPQLQYAFDREALRMHRYPRMVRKLALGLFPEAGAEEWTDDELLDATVEWWEDYVDEHGTDATMQKVADIVGISKSYASRVRKTLNKGEIAPAMVQSNLAVWRRSFYDAAVIRVANRLRAIYREEVKDLGEPGTALVRNERAALEDYLATLGLNLHSRSSQRTHDAVGAASGHEAGNRAGLSGHRKMSHGRGALPAGS